MIQFESDIDAEVRATLTDLLEGWLEADRTLDSATVSILSGGAVNRNFLVEAAGGKYVLRLAPPEENRAAIAVEMTNSAVVAQITGEAGVGPRVMGVKRPEGHTLIEFVPGVLNAETLREPGRLTDVGRAVRALHELPADGVRVVSAFDEIDYFLGNAREQGVDAASDLDEFLPRLESCRNILEAIEGRCLSHRDLNPQNCIYTGDSVVLIDWDFSGVDSPYLDLAMLVSYVDLTEEETRELVEAAVEDARPEDFARLKLMRFANALREWSWTLSARDVLLGTTDTDLTLLPGDAAQAEDFYAGYGEIYRGFARGFASDAEFDELLARASSELPAPGFR